MRMKPVKAIGYTCIFDDYAHVIGSYTVGDNEIWVYLAPGYCWENEYHVISEDSWADILGKLKSVTKCECNDCISGIWEAFIK